MEHFTARAVSDERVELGEGCRWDGANKQLLWVDILTGRLFCAKFDGEKLVTTSVYEVPGHLTAIAPFEDASQGWIIAANQGFSWLKLNGDVVLLAEPEAVNGGLVRMNDGACDPLGRFWAGSMAYDVSPGAGSLYRYGAEGRWTRVLSDVTISNGIGWSPDGELMYYVDSGAGTVSVMDFDLADGTVANRKTLIAVDPNQGVPDGLCVDEDGYLWVAIWGAGEVRRFSPDGEQVAVVELEASQPSCCALGGPDGRTLFITTARVDLPEETLARQPDAGRVFICSVETPGPAARTYRPSAQLI
jgi:sugar lactone lactonase YvrE